MAFPTDLTNAVDDITDAKAEQLNNLEAKVGIDSSTVKKSHDYKLSGVSDTDKAASLTGTETLTNKTLTSPTTTGTDDGVETLENKTLISPTTTGTDDGVETLENKTLTAPVMGSYVVSSADFILVKSGSNYIAYGNDGLAASTNEDFAVPLQYALDNLPAGGGKVVIKGGDTYTFTVAHKSTGYEGEDFDIGVDLNHDNTHIVIEKGATITQANGLALRVFFAGNVSGTGNGTYLDGMTIECHGWFDGNYTNQGYDTESDTGFQACPIAMYCTNSHFPIIRAKNYGQYGRLKTYAGPNVYEGYVYGGPSYE